MDELLDVLRKFDALRDGDAGGDVVHQRSLTEIAPTYADASALKELAPEITAALRDSGVGRLYQHQADAIAHAGDGANVVLQAPTASGKTLAFQVPLLQSLKTPGTHALMIYPNKALALDQRDQLMRLTEQMGHPRIESWWYDGDVDAETRRLLRETPPGILITNPDMLHNSFLGHADIWSEFYRGLTWVIVDEMHEYRGYFGSNVSGSAALFASPRVIRHTAAVLSEFSDVRQRSGACRESDGAAVCGGQRDQRDASASTVHVRTAKYPRFSVLGDSPTTDRQGRFGVPVEGKIGAGVLSDA